MNPLIPILLYVGAYALLFATWAAVVFLKVPGADSLVQYIQLTLSGLTGHVLTLIDPRRTTRPALPDVGKQAGFASIGTLIALAVGMALLLSGCASVQQAIDAYGAAAVTGVKATNETLIAANKVAMCATPVSALVRHPEMVPAVRSLCLPADDKGTVGQVLDAIKPPATQ